MGQYANADRSHAETVVRDFFAAWQPSPGGFATVIDRFFDDQTVWENVGIGTTIGKEQAIGFSTGFPIPLAYITAEDITIASAGDTVFAERVDHFHDDTGDVFLSVRLNGVFVIKNGKIAQWRDYFDTAGFAAEIQKAAANQ